jgi:hypothetical protein
MGGERGGGVPVIRGECITSSLDVPPNARLAMMKTGRTKARGAVQYEMRAVSLKIVFVESCTLCVVAVAIVAAQIHTATLALNKRNTSCINRSNHAVNKRRTCNEH